MFYFSILSCLANVRSDRAQVFYFLGLLELVKHFWLV